MVPGMYEPPRRYHVTITIARVDGWLPDPVSFAAAAGRTAWRRSASIVSADTADHLISVVTVHAPGRHAAQAVVSDALKHQGPTPSQHAGQARRGAAPPQTPAA